MPALVGTLMLLAFGGALVIGLGMATREKWLALAVVAGTLVALPLLVLSSGQNVQPRYVLPLLPILMGTALITRPVDLPVRFGRFHALLLVVAVVVAHCAALHRNIRRYVTGVDVGGADLGASVEWWWSRGPGPMATWLLGSIAFAVVAACVYRLLVAGEAKRPPVRTASGRLRYREPHGRVEVVQRAGVLVAPYGQRCERGGRRVRGRREHAGLRRREPAAMEAGGVAEHERACGPVNALAADAGTRASSSSSVG